MRPPTGPPIGLVLSRTAKTVSRAFDETLAAAGGGVPSWLILLSLKTRPGSNQRELAEAVGIRGATLTHHLNAMERDGLLGRRRDPNNRRIHQIELTEQGEALFFRMARAAQDFDKRLRTGLSSEEVTTVARLLGRLAANVGDD